MATDYQINSYLQQQLRRRGISTVAAVEAARWLNDAGLLADPKNRPGREMRRMLRKDKIIGGRQQPNRRRFIDRVEGAT